MEGEDESVCSSLLFCLVLGLTPARNLEDLSNKSREYENLLKDIGNIVDGVTCERIRDALDKVCFSCHSAQ